jgi:hypothetical protein
MGSDIVPANSVEVVDPGTGSWLFRVEPLPEGTVEVQGDTGSVATLRATAALLEHLPALREVATNRGVRVVFSKETTKLLRSGAVELVQSSTGLLPVARDAGTKAFVEIGKVVPGAAVTAGATGAIGVGGAAATVGGAATFGSLAVAAAPVLIVAGIAAATAYAEQRVMEKRFAEIQRAVERLEIRLRDDDLGSLEAADRLVDHLQADLAQGSVPPQLATELALARRDVERVYLSRRRFTGRFLGTLEEAQKRKAEKGSDRMRSGWAGEVADELRDRKSGVVDELALFVQAMVVRARLTAATAAVIASQGGGGSALRLIDDLDSELKHDYFELYRKLRALGRFGPEKSWWNALPGLGSLPLLGGQEGEDAKRRVASLVENMESLLGRAIDAHDRDVTVVLPAHVVAALLPAQ